MIYAINCNVTGNPKEDNPVIHSDGGFSCTGIFNPDNNRCTFEWDVPSAITGGGNLVWTNGDVRFVFPLAPGAYEGSDLGLPTIVYDTKPPYPPIPSRSEVLGVNQHFRGGLVVNCEQYGLMPWWPSALSWCNSLTRAISYEVARAAGDTHVVVEIPSGSPLYNEPGQFYSPDKFGPLDWTNGLTKIDSRFSDLIDEVISQGFKFIINMDEYQPVSIQLVRLVMEALSEKQLAYGFAMPGYDGVFINSGWTNEQIQQWAALARSIQPSCKLGLEHTPGKPPLGEGGADYQPNGRMENFDIVLGEFGENGSIHNDATWQILGRMVRPYTRAYDQPSGDDPNPPFYLTPNTRGDRQYCAWEDDDPYNWVRTDMNNRSAIIAAQQRIATNMTYYKSMGARFTG
jgi:hypothetical protein